MSFHIVTDSASDIPQETAAKWGITVMPIHTRFGEEEYLDGVTLKPEEFFEKLVKAAEVPRTSQVTPYEFGQAYKKAADAGEEVLCITMSAGVSGTYESACIAAAEWGDKVTVIDSRQFCISLYALVEYACRLRDEGKTLAQAAALIEENKKRVHVISVFDTLEYLRLGGRLSAAAAMAGNILSIKPVITITDGVVEVIAKARGSKKAGNMMTEFVRRVGGIDFAMPCCLGYTGSSKEALMKYVRDNAALFHRKEDSGESRSPDSADLPVVPVGATVGTYAGPGAFALAFFER